MASVLLSFLIKVPRWHLYFFSACLHESPDFTHCWFYAQGYRLSVCLFIVKKVCQINCYSQVRWHYSVFEGCTSNLFFFLSLVLIYTLQEQNFDLLDAQKGSFADEANGKVIDSSSRKICLLQVNVSQQMLSYRCLVRLVCKILFHCDYDDQHLEVSILPQCNVASSISLLIKKPKKSISNAFESNRLYT